MAIQNISIPLADEASSIVIDGIASESISALKAVKITGIDSISVADSTLTYNDSLCIGVAVNAAVLNGQVSVISYGVLEDPFLTFPINDILYLSSNGSITNTPPSIPTDTHRTIIGKSLGNGVIFISITETIIL